jgi:hypothetical protein
MIMGYLKLISKSENRKENRGKAWKELFAKGAKT